MKFKRIISIVLAITIVLTTALSVSPAKEAHASGNCPNCWGSFYNNTVSDWYVRTEYRNEIILVGSPRIMQADIYYVYQPTCNICGLACGPEYSVYGGRITYYG